MVGVGRRVFAVLVGVGSVGWKVFAAVVGVGWLGSTGLSGVGKGW